MLNQQTIEKLDTLRMRGMADAFTQCGRRRVEGADPVPREFPQAAGGGCASPAQCKSMSVSG